MDSPIYIHHTFYEETNRDKPRRIRNQLYVIEGRDGAAGEEVAKTDEERVGVFNLPDLDDIFSFSSIYVANSHLFMVGGQRTSEVRYVDLQHKDSSWEKIALDNDDFGYFGYSGGMAVLDGDQIEGFGLGGKKFSFHPNNLNVKPTISFWPPSPDRNLCPILLAVTETRKMYVLWGANSEPSSGELGYYELDSLSIEWHTIDPDFTWATCSRTAVVVEDQYLISFSYCHPEVDFDPTNQVYDPGLYVYDTKARKWLAKPVQGLSSVFDSDIFLTYVSVMQVSPLKYALVWSVPYTSYSLLHCTKFTISIEEEDTDPPTLTFHARLLSSICSEFPDLTLRIDSTTATATPLSLEETPSNLPMKRKWQALEG